MIDRCTDYHPPSGLLPDVEGSFYCDFLARLEQLASLPKALSLEVGKKIEAVNPNGDFYTWGKGKRLLNLITQEYQSIRAELATDNSALIEYAEIKAKDYRTVISRLGAKAGYRWACACLAELDIKAPSAEKLGLMFAINRVTCPKWWRRALRVAFSRRLENFERRFGLTNAHKGIYCSHDTFNRYRQQQRRNHNLIEQLEAVNEHGEICDLKMLIDASVSNPVNRRNELMTRLRGAEEYAQSVGHIGVFYTLTCPSRYHVKGYKRRTGDKRSVVYDNPNYDGSTPKEAGKYLQDIWAKVRAKFKREGVNYYGFRVIEPHHDGTPHWHIMLFCPAESEAFVTDVLRSYCFVDCPDEAGAKAHRFKAVMIDWQRGSACGYLAKYIAKAIDGYALEWDLYGKSAKDGALRIKAWASTHGFRQFDDFGLPPVGVWRLLRKLSVQAFSEAQKKGGKGKGFGDFATILNCAHSADYCGFIEEYHKLGERIKLLKVKGKEALTRYGDIAAHKVKGIVLDLVDYITNLHWIIQPKRIKDVLTDALATAWTCINNYTAKNGGLDEQVNDFHLRYA